MVARQNKECVTKFEIQINNTLFFSVYLNYFRGHAYTETYL